MPKSLLSITDIGRDRPMPPLTEEELKGGDSAIIRRQRIKLVSGEPDLFDQARKIYLRGRRRYTRRAARII